MGQFDDILERRVRIFGVKEVRLEVVLLCLLLICFGILRIFWSTFRTDVGASGEAALVAEALAQGRGFADAYRGGHGPTAHLMPISPAIAGGVYALFGIRTMFSEILLASWSLFLIIGAFFFLYRSFKMMGNSRFSLLVAIALLTFSPSYVAQEAVDYRIWDGGLAVFLSSAVFMRIIMMEERTVKTDSTSLLLTSSIAALLMFVSPIVGGAAVIGLVIVAFRRLTISEIIFAGIAGVLAMALLFAPWTMRNFQQFDEFIPTRGNAGLELAIGLHPAALRGDDQGQAFEERMNEIHPARTEEAYAAMEKAGGEVEYARMLGVRTWEWAKSHPLDTILLMASHAKQTIAPPPWIFSPSGVGRLVELRSLYASIIGIAGILAVLFGLFRGPFVWAYIATYLMAAILLMSPFQPVPRYTYLYFPMLAFCASTWVSRFEDRLFLLFKYVHKALSRGAV